MDTSFKALQGYLGHSVNAELVFVFLAAAAVFVFSLGAFALLLAVANPLRRRLGHLRPDQSAQEVPWSAILSERLAALSRLAQPGKATEVSRTQLQLMHAGYRSPHALPLFYAAKAILLAALPLAVLSCSWALPTVSSGRMMFYAGISAFLGSVFPGLWLDRRVQSRQRDLRAAFPDALDLLVVCVESGLGLAPALQRVADELSVSHPELGDELSLVNSEMRAGVDRPQALKNLAERTGLEDIRGLVALMVQTMRFGTSVADALRVYSEEFRDKRMQAAEEQAAKIGTKMIFPLVACLFPSFFLVAIGPAILRLVDVFGQLAH